MAQPRDVPADDRFIQLPDAGDLRQTDEQDAAEGEQDGGHRQAAKPQPPKQPKNCHSSWPETKPAPKKQPAKRKASLGTLSCFTKPLPFFNLSHYIIFLSP